MLLKRIMKKAPEARTANEGRYAELLFPFHELDTEKCWEHFQQMKSDDIDWLMEVTLTHSFFQFLAPEVQFFNCYARKHKTVSSERWGATEWANNLGIIEVPKEDKETPYMFSVRVNGAESRKFRLIHNSTNRGFTESNAKRYGKFMSSRRWADNGETIIFDHTGEVASAQHRGAAAYPVCLGDSTLKIPVTVVRGIPRQLVGSVETGRKRTKKDEANRFKELLRHVVKPLGGMPNYGNRHEEVCTKVNNEMVSAIDAVLLRAHGQDVHASTTGIDSDSQFDFLERCPDFPALVALCYAHLEGSNKKGGPGIFSVAQYATVLLLYANSDNPSEVTTLPGVGRQKFRREVELPDFIEVDLDFAEKFLSSLNLGWLSPLTTYLNNPVNKAKYKKHYRMQALVNAVKYFEANHQEVPPQPVLDSTTNKPVILPDGSTQMTAAAWTAPVLPSHGVPPLRDATWKWDGFGGLDIGPFDENAINVSTEKEELATV